MKTAFVILACEVVVLGVVVAAFLLNESHPVRLPPAVGVAAAPARVPSSVPVSIAFPGVTGHTMTAAFSVHGGEAVAVEVSGR